MNTKRTIGSLLVVATLGMADCTTYYKVDDPTTGKVYYTTKVEKKDGATVLHDDTSGKDVTIQNSEVMKITEDQYKAANK